MSSKLDINIEETISDTDQPQQLDPNRIPKHIAIIMDGNRRWATSHDLDPVSGHWRGAEALIEICSSASKLGVKTLTVYAFSTENWARSDQEIASLFKLIEAYCLSQKPRMLREGVRLRHIGNLDPIPYQSKSIFLQTEEDTKDCDVLDLVIALNYGSRDEIRRGILSMMNDVESGSLKKEEISNSTLSSYLDTKEYPDPELIIRTSGEMRLSNFLLFQASYSELVITKTLWPDFTPENLEEAVLEYQNRQKRMGV